MSLHSAAQSILSGAEILHKSPTKQSQHSSFQNEKPGSLGVPSPALDNLQVPADIKTGSALAAPYRNSHHSIDLQDAVAGETASNYSRVNKDPRTNFSWFKDHIMQILESYDRTVSQASSIQTAEIQIVAFGRLLLLKLTEVFPNLKDEMLGPLVTTKQSKPPETVNSIRESQTFKPQSTAMRQIDAENEMQKLLERQKQQIQELLDEQNRNQQRQVDEQNRQHQRMLDSVGGNIERLDYKMERLTQSVARQQNVPVAALNSPTKTPTMSPFKMFNPKFDSQISQIDQSASLRKSRVAAGNATKDANEDQPIIFTQKSSISSVDRTRSYGQNAGQTLLPPIERLNTQQSVQEGDAMVETQKFSAQMDMMGPNEYFERREHTKLHEKLDFLAQQLARVDRNVKCLALTDGANLALQTMMDASQLSDFEKLRRNTLPARTEAKSLLKMSGSKQVHLVPVVRDNYQLVLVNNMHEVIVYRDHYGLSPDDVDSQEVQVEPTGSLQLVERISVPHMSACVVANDTLVIGTNIKQGWLQAYDLNTFQETAKSSAMLAEAVTCMCQGEDAGTLIVGMNDSKVAAIKAGRNYLEVLGSFSLASQRVKTFHSISRTSRGDFVVGTVSGVCFIQWQSVQKKFEVIKQTPTSSQGPPLTLLPNRQTLSCREVAEDLFVTSDYNQPGYYLINRATKDVKKLEEQISDNRGCFDIAPLPTFHAIDFPFVLMKGRKGVVLANLSTLATFELLRTPEMQGNSSFHKLTVAKKRALPGRQATAKVDLVVTHIEWVEGKTIVEQLDLPELFLRALSLNGEI